MSICEICDDSLLFHPQQAINKEFPYLNWNIHRNITHIPLVPDIFVSESGQHWFRYWLFDYLAPSHYQNAGLLSIRPLGTNFNEIVIEIVTKLHSRKCICVCEMVSILSRDRWPKRVPCPIYFEQGKSEWFDSCDQPSNLAQIWSKSSISQPLGPWNLMDDLQK